MTKGTANYFRDYGFITGKKSPAAVDLVLEAVPDLEAFPSLSHSQFVEHTWAAATSDLVKAENLRGGIFEAVLAAAFIRAGATPFYTQVQIQHVPNVNFDFIFWTNEYGPVAVSAKTSLRERYKQADLEAMALLNVHRKSKTYLVTLDASEAARVKSKIAIGDVLALTDVVIANTGSFDELVDRLIGLSRMVAPILPSVVSGAFIRRTEVDTIDEAD
jgi:hypothetical protein